MSILNIFKITLLIALVIKFIMASIIPLSGDEAYLQELNERKKKYPQFKHPFL